MEGMEGQGERQDAMGKVKYLDSDENSTILSKVKRKMTKEKQCLSRPGFVGVLAVKFVY
jgi:hypothetical protein